MSYKIPIKCKKSSEGFEEGVDYYCLEYNLEGEEADDIFILVEDMGGRQVKVKASDFYWTEQDFITMLDKITKLMKNVLTQDQYKRNLKEVDSLEFFSMCKTLPKHKIKECSADILGRDMYVALIFAERIKMELVNACVYPPSMVCKCKQVKYLETIFDRCSDAIFAAKTN